MAVRERRPVLLQLDQLDPVEAQRVVDLSPVPSTPLMVNRSDWGRRRFCLHPLMCW